MKTKVVANEKYLLSLARQFGKLEEPVPYAGKSYRDIERFGVYEEPTSKLTLSARERQIFVLYAALTLIALHIFKSKYNKCDFFYEVYKSVARKEQILYSTQHTSFPYEDREFPYYSTLNNMLSNVSSVISVPLVRIKVRPLGERSIVHEWTVKPGKRLYLEFIDGIKTDTSIYEAICGKYGLANHANEYSQEILVSKVGSIILEKKFLAHLSFWYVLSACLSYLLIRNEFKDLCE